ncbi:MAG: polyprenyl synthetase family protein [Chloroflexi bacterium]|nr:polyprenyl synthetase family protein [Chloroflexota bacterium]
MSTLDARLDDLIRQIDGWMRPYVEQTGGPADRFYQMMAYHHGWVNADGSPLSPPARTGKRIRPILAILACEAYGGEAEDARGPAVAIELIHNFSLVHDDIQDVSDQRHNRDTIWKLWGPAQGINVGDALFALAQVALVEGTATHPRLADGVLLLNRTCVRLVEGQYLDLAMESAADVTYDQYEAMISRKTAALLSCSAALGAWAAGAPSDAIQRISDCIRELGIAFQLQDDLLGVWGDPKITGKPARDDVRSRKKALPMVQLVATATGSLRAELLQILHAAETPDEPTVDQLVGWMDEMGVHARVTQMVHERFDRAERLLGEAVPAGQDGPMRELFAKLRVRDY